MEVLVVTENVPEVNSPSLTFWNSGTGTRLLSLKGPPAVLPTLSFCSKTKDSSSLRRGRGSPSSIYGQPGPPPVLQAYHLSRGATEVGPNDGDAGWELSHRCDCRENQCLAGINK